MDLRMFPFSVNEWLIEQELNSMQSDCVGGYRDPETEAAAEASIDSDIYWHWVEDLMNRGMEAFRVRDYTTAAKFFKTLLDMQTRRYGERDPQSCQTYLRYGLALLYETPLRTGDNLFAALPGEADYLLCSDPNFVDSGDHMNCVPYEESCAEREELQESLPWKQLFRAWDIAGAQQNHTLEKFDIMCALGESDFRLGKPNGFRHTYFEWALCMMKNLIADGLIEATDLRRAHIYFKICLSIQTCPYTEEAVEYCELAINVCRERIRMLIEESDGCCKRKKEDVELATKFCNLFEKELENLQNSLNLQNLLILQKQKPIEDDNSPKLHENLVDTTEKLTTTRKLHWAKEFKSKARKTIFGCFSN